MKGLLFVRIGLRYTCGIVSKNSYYYVYFSKRKMGFKVYRDQIDAVLEFSTHCYFLGFIKLI